MKAIWDTGNAAATQTTQTWAHPSVSHSLTFFWQLLILFYPIYVIFCALNWTGLDKEFMESYEDIL